MVPPMSQLHKLKEAIRNNPKDVRYDDAVRVAEAIGFQRSGGKGSHAVYARRGESVQLNFQKKDGGRVAPYQVRQLIEMMDKYDA